METVYLIAVIRHNDAETGKALQKPYVERVMTASSSALTLTYVGGSGYTYLDVFHADGSDYEDALTNLHEEINRPRSWFGWVKPFLEKE